MRHEETHYNDTHTLLYVGWNLLLKGKEGKKQQTTYKKRWDGSRETVPVRLGGKTIVLKKKKIFPTFAYIL